MHFCNLKYKVGCYLHCLLSCREIFNFYVTFNYEYVYYKCIKHLQNVPTSLNEMNAVLCIPCEHRLG